MSSAISGFFFWGISDDPVVEESPILANFHSAVDHNIGSTQNLLRCIIQLEQPFKKSITKSQSDTASIALLQRYSNPSFSFRNLTSRGSVEPARAPDPKGILSDSLITPENLSLSLSNIST